MSLWNPLSWRSSGTIQPLKTHREQAAAGHRVSDRVPTQPERRDLAQIVADMRGDYQVSFCERILGANIAAIQVTASGEGVPEDLIATMQTLWDRTLPSMLDSIAYGRVAYELEWDIDGLYQVPCRAEPLPFELSRMSLCEGRFNGIDVKTGPDTWEPIAVVNAWWLAIDATVAQPHGRSRFLPAPYEVWKDKKGAKKNRKTATNKWGTRGPIMRGPITDTDPQTQQVYEVLPELAPAVDTWSDGGLLYLSNERDNASPEGKEYKFAIEQADLTGFDPTAINNTIERMDVEMARAFGIAEQTIMEAGGVGTYGSITQKMLLLFAVCEGMLDQWCRSFEKYVIGKTLEINGLPDDAITLSYTSLAQRPDSFVFEAIKILLANPNFAEGLLAGGVDIGKMLEDAGFPVTEQVGQTMQAIAQRLAATAQAGVPLPTAPTGEMAGLGRRQWQNNRKAINDVLQDVIAGTTSEVMAKELLQSLGVPAERAQVFIDDAKDGKVDDAELTGEDANSGVKSMSDFFPDGFMTLFDESKVKRDGGKFAKKEGAKAAPKQKWIPTAQGVKDLDSSRTYEPARKIIQTLFGVDATLSGAIGLLGAKDAEDADADWYSSDSILTLKAWGPNKSYFVKRTIAKRADGSLTCENDLFTTKQNGTGIGAKMFARQVMDMSRVGVSEITTLAARHSDPGDNKFVGYKVWPKLGYDGQIPESVQAKLPKDLRGASSVRQLMMTPGGRKFWETNGTNVKLTFDNRKGSDSRKVLAAYLREKRKQDPSYRLSDAVRESTETDDPLAAGDEAILDKIYDQIAAAGGLEQWARSAIDDIDDQGHGQPAAMSDAKRLAQVPIPRQGFKVPDTAQVLNAGLREFDRLFEELVAAMSKRASQATLNGIRKQIVALEAELRTVGRLLGMLAPWQPRAVTYAGGAAQDADKLPMTLADSGYKFPWIEDAVDFLESKGVVTAEQFAKMAEADRVHVFSAPGIDTTKQLKSIQTKLANSLSEGTDFATFRKSIEDDVALTRSQTETMYRTETKRGYVAGLDKALAAPLVRDEFPAVMFSATTDQRVRDSHWDLDGFVCLRDDAAYNVLKRACGDYNCRCAMIPLSLEDAERYGIKTYSDLPSDVRAKYA